MTEFVYQPAASLILMRDRADGPPEILMVQRAATMAFAGGLWVFPGGRVEPADLIEAAIAEGDEEASADSMARVAAIRETIEEVGIAVGITPPPPDLDTLRARLATEEPLAALLAGVDHALDLDALVPFARWRPPFKQPRMFDTRFYIARVPAGTDAIPDGGESVAVRWIGAAEAVAEAEHGTMAMMFPTQSNLVRLAEFDSFEAAAAAAAEIEIRILQPRPEERDGVLYLSIPPGHGYPELTVLANPARK